MSALNLVLLRHAHAEPARLGQHDAERALSPRGVEEAADAARWLLGHVQPARALCSPARRTQQTLEPLRVALDGLAVVEEARIYEATPGELIDVIEAHRDAGCLLLVGHNPGMESLVALLATGQSGDHRGMPPAGVAILSFPDGAAIEPGAAELTAFWSP